jgi:hypothetical protein
MTGSGKRLMMPEAYSGAIPPTMVPTVTIERKRRPTRAGARSRGSSIRAHIASAGLLRVVEFGYAERPKMVTVSTIVDVTVPE